MSKENKAIVERWYREFWGNPCNLDIVDELAGPDILVHHHIFKPKKGREAIAAFMAALREAFPDLDLRIVDSLIAEGDLVVARWDCDGSHTGSQYGPLPAGSGRTVNFTGTSVFRLENGKILEEVGQEDVLTIARQLGLTSADRASPSTDRYALPIDWFGFDL